VYPSIAPLNLLVPLKRHLSILSATLPNPFESELWYFTIACIIQNESGRG